MIPRRISMFWAQGEAAAPDLVKRCWDAWARLNPGWSLEIADESHAAASFRDLGLTHVPTTLQGRGDIFRVQDLDRNGGVYVDCGTIPCAPLDAWLEPLTHAGFFAFHDPYRHRPVENWFLVSEPGHAITRGWLEAMRGYWDRPRRAQSARRELDRGGKGALACRLAGMRGAETRKRVIEPKDRLWSVQPGGGADRPVHPYFWPHYLFDLQLHRSEPFRTAWAEVPKRPSYRHLMVRHWKRDYARMTDQELLSLLDAPMQKLSLKSAPSEQQLELIFGQAERATP